jgi:pimeloyl-ACP methyl ester carboxylesterase
MLQADIYEAVAKEEGLSSVVLVAHDMGQTVGVELMARQEEGRPPFKIRHAILVNGSTLVDMIQLAPIQVELLAAIRPAELGTASEMNMVADCRTTTGHILTLLSFFCSAVSCSERRSRS